MQNDLDKAVEGMLMEIDQGYFFPLLRDSFQCQARCCEKSRTRMDLQTCIGQCNQRVESVQGAMDHELKHFQQRLQRCAMQCQDEAKDSLGANPNQKQIDKAQDKAVQCVEKCGKEMLGKIPKLKDSLKSVFQ